jgi:hypothetical protein
MSDLIKDLDLKSITPEPDPREFCASWVTWFRSMTGADLILAAKAFKRRKDEWVQMDASTRG